MLDLVNFKPQDCFHKSHKIDPFARMIFGRSLNKYSDIGELCPELKLHIVEHTLAHARQCTLMQRKLDL